MPPKQNQHPQMAKVWHSKIGTAMKTAMKRLGVVTAWKSAAGKAFKRALKK